MRPFRWSADNTLAALLDFGVLHRRSILRMTFAGITYDNSCITNGVSTSVKLSSSPTINGSSYDAVWSSFCGMSVSASSGGTYNYYLNTTCAGAPSDSSSIFTLQFSLLSDTFSITLGLGAFGGYVFRAASIPRASLTNGAVISNDLTASGWYVTGGPYYAVGYNGTVTIEGAC